MWLKQDQQLSSRIGSGKVEVEYLTEFGEPKETRFAMFLPQRCSSHINSVVIITSILGVELGKLNLHMCGEQWPNSLTTILSHRQPAICVCIPH